MGEGKDRRGSSASEGSIAKAASELAALRRLAWQRMALAVAAALAAGLMARSDPPLAMALTAGFAAGTFLALVSFSRRRALLFALAADRASYALPEVGRFGAALTRPAKRLALAHMVATVMLDASRPDTIYLVDRVAAQAPALSAIAEALADPDAVVEPVAVVGLIQLLTDGSGSPLLNPKVASVELSQRVKRIQLAIHPPPAPRSPESRQLSGSSRLGSHRQ